MLNYINRYVLLFLCFVLYSIAAHADQKPISFHLLPSESHIKFQATQGGAPIKGEFKNFVADINFHPEALSQSKVKVIIDMSSFVVDDKDAKDSLANAQWFNVTSFPQAIFEAESFKFLGDKKYEALGKLTIKGHAEPTTLSFTLNEFSKTNSHVIGVAILKRKAFNVGEESTDSIMDEVRVDIDIKADAINASTH